MKSAVKFSMLLVWHSLCEDWSVSFLLCTCGKNRSFFVPGAVYMRELNPGRVSSRNEFHLGVWSFGFWCLHDPGVKFAHPGTISSRSSAPGRNFIPGSKIHVNTWFFSVPGRNDIFLCLLKYDQRWMIKLCISVYGKDGHFVKTKTKNTEVAFDIDFIPGWNCFPFIPWWNQPCKRNQNFTPGWNSPRVSCKRSPRYLVADDEMFRNSQAIVIGQSYLRTMRQQIIFVWALLTLSCRLKCRYTRMVTWSLRVSRGLGTRTRKTGRPSCLSRLIWQQDGNHSRPQRLRSIWPAPWIETSRSRSMALAKWIAASGDENGRERQLRRRAQQKYPEGSGSRPPSCCGRDVIRDLKHARRLRERLRQNDVEMSRDWSENVVVGRKSKT